MSALIRYTVLLLALIGAVWTATTVRFGGHTLAERGQPYLERWGPAALDWATKTLQRGIADLSRWADEPPPAETSSPVEAPPTPPADELQRADKVLRRGKTAYRPPDRPASTQERDALDARFKEGS